MRRLAPLAALTTADPSCWMDGVTWEQCCAAKFGPEGNAGCWGGDFTFERCCVDETLPQPAAVGGTGAYPDCVVSGVVLRHAGENAVFADLSRYGHSGCFLNNCQVTDKFDASDMSICARACAAVEECSHWSYGQQSGAKKCFLRKSDAGRASLPHWTSALRSCAPPALPAAAAARQAANSPALQKCDKGKSEDCPNVVAAMNTWLFAIEHMQTAFRGRVDSDTWGHIEKIGKESRNFLAQLSSNYRPSDKDFPRVIYNNRLIFTHLDDALAQQPAAAFSSEDASLPNPLRFGVLCGNTSCYEL